MSFTINNKLIFIDSYQFQSSSLNSLVKNLSKDNIKYFSQEFNNCVLDLLKQKGFYPYECMSNCETFKEDLPSKEKICCLLTDRIICDKEYGHVHKAWKK